MAECKDYSWEGRGTNKLHMCGSVPKPAMSPRTGTAAPVPQSHCTGADPSLGLGITHINVYSQPGIQPIPMGSGIVAVFMD